MDTPSSRTARRIGHLPLTGGRIVIAHPLDEGVALPAANQREMDYGLSPQVPPGRIYTMAVEEIADISAIFGAGSGR